MHSKIKDQGRNQSIMTRRKSRYNRGFGGFKWPKLQLRYLAIGVALVCLVSLLLPENNDAVVTQAQQTESYMPDVAQMTNIEPASGEVSDNESGDLKDLLDFKPALSFENFVENRKDKKLAAYLNDLEPAAGQPTEVGGVFLPEPRPTILKKLKMSPGEVSQRIKDIEGTGLVRTSAKIKSGGTLADTLVDSLGVGYQDAHDFVESIKSVFDPHDIKPGQSVSAYVAEVDNAPMLMAAVIEKDMISSVAATRLSQNRFSASEIIKPTKLSLKAVQGTIDNSLYLSADAMDVPDAVTVELIRIYSWAIDFQRDIRRGDKFEILYEQYQTEDGQIVPNKGNIRYSTLLLGDRPYSMYRYETLDGRVDFFEPDGRSIRKALMKTPIDGARLSSGYGTRTHPVLGYKKMHKGLDFAAPRGTPIYAAGDGVIERMGPFSSYGNYVRIRHREGLKTAYAHMKGFKRGLRSGSRVKQGDVIGYVGTTGRSTGPHLHYEVHVNGAKVNPRTVKLPTGEKLKGQDLVAFKEMIGAVNKEFASMGLGKTIASLSAAGATKTN